MVPNNLKDISLPTKMFMTDWLELNYNTSLDLYLQRNN